MRARVGFVGIGLMGLGMALRLPSAATTSACDDGCRARSRGAGGATVHTGCGVGRVGP